MCILCLCLTYCRVVEVEGSFITVADGIGFKTVNTPGDKLQISLSGLKPDTKYRFNVFAVNEIGAGAISDEVTARTYSSSGMYSALYQ